ncbi:MULTISPECIES: ABC transporter ATP-binding protein [unclassified Coleofasciculus]|uniref:ABC transporter ATP-binding protein n=1 Tax=unclassified Coleofasciculus TaxID=2692782 RepID=UPI00188158D6|nr:MULTISPECIES: ABC transporter ATP-binding protein/permease [unclassified Coleofasciculus]MBE9125343.1 ABC transporter ATP-binding protein/permease [Coleofasciculus sp. LEGE 07081]MBE9148546.1 ABC transporter ATP-binding protein/permease [Coleofasciculus sp. LEGE 07092]
MIAYLSKVLYVLTERKKNLLLLLLMFALTSILEALGIGLIGPFLNIASNPDSIRKIALLDWTYQELGLQSSRQLVPIVGGVIIGVFCVKSILYFFSKSYIFKFSFNQKRILMSRLLNAYLIVPYTFHLSRNTATIIKNIISETNQFTQNCLLPLLNATANFVVVAVLLILLAKTNLLLLVLILGVLVPTFLLFQKFGKKFSKWGKIKSETQKEMIRVINHGLGGLKETRVIGCEPYFESQMEQQTHKYARAATLFQSSQLLPRILIETTLIIFLVGFISLSIVFSEQNLEDLTAVMGIFAVAALRLIPASSQFMQALGSLRNSSYALDMLYLDLKEIEKEELNKRSEFVYSAKREKSVNSHSGKSQAMTFFNQIDLIDLTYRYPGTSDLALEDISLTIKKGESIALIGKSGAGKTTLVDVILGLLEPESGDIRVDEVSVYKNLRYWQNLIGYIPQSIFLLDETIERNIAFGVPSKLIDSERLDKAIKAAQLEELVEQLPDGIKTGVGERGVRLSGGQRQRIGIARAIYHEREILVLDEATSALDNETERLVSESIRSLAGTKTLIIIAHRLSTVEHCDRVYLMEKGCVVKWGSYEEVVLEK